MYGVLEWAFQVTTVEPASHKDDVDFQNVTLRGT